MNGWWSEVVKKADRMAAIWGQSIELIRLVLDDITVMGLQFFYEIDVYHAY